MNSSDAIKKALPIFAKSRELDDEALRETLREAGFDDEILNQLVEFLPLAFGRVLMKHLNLALSDEYIRYSREDGKPVEKMRKKLGAELIYALAIAMASTMARKIFLWRIGLSKKHSQFHAVAERSAEVRVVMVMLEKGVQPENIVFTSPSLQWRE